MIPNRDQLISAHREADLAGTLDEALTNPLLARCLAITAAALGREPQHTDTGTARLPATVSTRNYKHAAVRDFKRACAADTDD